MMGRITFTNKPFLILINNYPQQTGFINQIILTLPNNSNRKPNILLLTILIYQRTLQAPKGNNVLWLQLSFFSWCDNEFNCLYKPTKGSAYLTTLYFILRSHQIDPQMFYNVKKFSTEAFCDD